MLVSLLPTVTLGPVVRGQRGLFRVLSTGLHIMLIVVAGVKSEESLQVSSGLPSLQNTWTAPPLERRTVGSGRSRRWREWWERNWMTWDTRNGKKHVWKQDGNDSDILKSTTLYRDKLLLFLLFIEFLAETLVTLPLSEMVFSRVRKMFSFLFSSLIFSEKMWNDLPENVMLFVVVYREANTVHYLITLKKVTSKTKYHKVNALNFLPSCESLFIDWNFFLLL